MHEDSTNETFQRSYFHVMSSSGGSPLCRTKKFRPIKTKRTLKNGRNVTEIRNEMGIILCAALRPRVGSLCLGVQIPLLLCFLFLSWAFTFFHISLQTNLWQNRRNRLRAAVQPTLALSLLALSNVIPLNSVDH